MHQGLVDEAYPPSQERALIKSMDGLFQTIEREVEMGVDDEKVEKKAEITEAMNKTRLGYATVCFGTDNDLGRGPTIHRAFLNPRSIKPSGIAILKELHTGKQLVRFSSEASYHITILVRRKVINVDALEQNVLSPRYPRIEWKDLTDFKNEKVAIVADGNHRATLCEQLCTEDMKNLVKLRNKLELGRQPLISGPNTNLDKMNIEKITANIQALGDWHCVIYDWGKFNLIFLFVSMKLIL